MISMYIHANQTDWDQFIPYCVFAYNTSRHETNKFTPYYLLFGTEPNLPIDAMSRTDEEEYTNANDYCKTIIARMRIAHKAAEDAQRSIHKEYLEKFQVTPYHQYKVGDKVYCQFAQN